MAKKVKDAIDKGAKRAKDATDKAAAATKKATDRAAKAAKEATDKVAGGAKAAADRIDGVRENLKKSGEKMKASGEKIAKQGSAVSMKIIEHAEENTHQAFTAMRAAASAKNPAEVAKIQSEYLKQQGARALTHAREIGELIMQFGRGAMGEAKK